MQHVSKTFDFFAQLNSLLKSNISLVEALNVLSHLKGKQTSTQLIAMSVLGNLKKGYNFSRSLLLCSLVRVPSGITHLFEAAEHSACIQEVLDYVCAENEKHVKMSREIQDIVVYPVFVVFTALIGTFFLIYWKDQFLTTITTDEIVSVVIRALAIFISFLCVLTYYVYTSLKMPLLFQFYYTVGFLQKFGFTFCTSLDLFAGIYATNDEYEKMSYARYEIRKGIAVSEVLRKSHLADERMYVLLEIAEHTGTMAQTCCAIADGLARTHEIKKRRCLQLLEPLLLFSVGVYLIILIEGILIPYMTDLGGVL